MSETPTLDKLRAVIAELDAAPPSMPTTIYETHSLLITETRERTWRERLLTLPWRPLQRQVTTHAPDPDCYQTKNGIFAHPATARRLRAAIAGDTNE